MPKLVDGKLVPDSENDNNDIEGKKSLIVDDSTEETKNVPTVTNPLGPNVDKETIEKHPPADKSSIGAYNPDTLQYNTRTQNPEALIRIEKVLRDGGMDSMSTMRSLQAISQILDDVDVVQHKHYSEVKNNQNRIK